MRRLLAILALLCGLANAQTAERAQSAAAEDLASTAIGLALGAAEANHIGLLTVPGKWLMLKHADTLPTGERAHTLSAITAIWRGASANNVCVIAAIATGGTFGPVCVLAGLVVAAQQWESTSAERQFWAICAAEKQSNPRLKCTYTTPA